MALDVTSAAAALKVYYNKQKMQQLMYKDAPLFAMLQKFEDFYGASYPLPMRVTNPQGRAAQFSNAQAQKKESNYKTFSLTRVKDYALASIETEAMLASENDAGAFVRLATAEINGAIDSLKRSIQWSLYGNGSGSLGTISAVSTANNTVTFTNVDDISKIEVGQTLNIYSAESGGSIRTYNGSSSDLNVSGVDRDTGIVTFTQDITGSGDIAPSDYVFVKGDRGLKLSGLAAWIPSSTPSSSLFFGVDRTVDATRLAGVRMSGAGKPQDEALVDAARTMGRHGANPDHVFTNFTKYAALEKTLGARVRYKDVEVAGIGFRGIEIAGPQRSMMVVPDRDAPTDKQYMLTLDTCGLYTLKEPVQILDQDGNKFLRESSADALEIRVAMFGQFGCDMPGHNGVISY